MSRHSYEDVIPVCHESIRPIVERNPLSDLDPVQVNYVREFTKLSLWYVHKRIRDGESDFEDAVNCRVNIYRNTSLYDGTLHPSKDDVGPEWAEVLDGLRQIFDRHTDDPSTVRLEDEALTFLWPYLEERLRGGGDTLPALEDRPYGCWRFDARSGYINLHILNVYRPRSPLSDLIVPFAAALIRLLHDAHAERPYTERVRCGSWLNSFPTFQTLFPERWKQSASYRPIVRYSNGHWGQFVDRQGDFHARNGARFRETGAFPFASTVCQCPIDEVVAHLEKTFPEAVEYNQTRSSNQP